MTLCVLDVFAAYHCCEVLTQTGLPCYNSVRQDGSSVLLYPTLEMLITSPNKTLQSHRSCVCTCPVLYIMLNGTVFLTHSCVLILSRDSQPVLVKVSFPASSWPAPCRPPQDHSHSLSRRHLHLRRHQPLPSPPFHPSTRFLFNPSLEGLCQH